MREEEIRQRCTRELGMSDEEAQFVVNNLYVYAMPDFSEWDWTEIDQCFRDVLWFRGKTDAEIEEALKS